MYIKAVLKKRQKITPKPICKCLNKFINKNSKNESDALFILLIYSSIPSLLSLKKRNRKIEQPIKGIYRQTAVSCSKLLGIAVII